MNWNAVAATAEFFGAMGVIASLLYLALQVRQNTRTAEDAAFRGIFSAVNDHLHEMMSSENLPVVLRGLKNFQILDSSERFRFDSLMAGYLNLIESSMISNRSMLLSDEAMECWGYYLRTRFLSYDGALSWWEEAQTYFSSQFREWMETQIARADRNSDIWRIK